MAWTLPKWQEAGLGEIADMMLDGTMDCETGEWNFDGADGPGFPMTGAEAAQYRRDMRGGASTPGVARPPGQGRSKRARQRRAKRLAAEAKS